MKKLTDIEGILNSLQGAGRAEPKPFLLTRVNAALPAKETTGVWSRVVALLQKPAVAFSLIAVILLFNVSVFLAKNSQAADATARIEKATSSSADFAINVKSLYDVENGE